MAITLTLYNFSKRRNSTKAPTGGTNFDVVLKHPTSMNHPVFQLAVDDPTGFNYAKFNGKYYWIDDIISDRNNVWSIQCSVDPLATCKSDILSTTAYVEYCTQGNVDLVDNRLGVEFDSSLTTSNATFSIIDTAHGSYFLALIGEDRSDTVLVSGTVAKRIMNDATQWSTNIIDTTDIVSTVSSAFTQTLAQGSAADCIKAAYWLPFNSDMIFGNPETICLGDFVTHHTGKYQIPKTISETVTVSINHVYSDWRKSSPYTMVYVALPFYGVLEIPSDIAANNTTLDVTLKANLLSGDFVYNIKGGSDPSYSMQVGGNVYAPFLIGASNINAPVSAGGVIATAVAGVLGNIPAVLAGAAATLAGLSPTPTASGSIGGVANLTNTITCLTRTRSTSATPLSLAGSIGIPYFKTATLSNLSGFVKCHMFSLQSSEDSDIIDSVNELMNTGVFIE